MPSLSKEIYKYTINISLGLFSAKNKQLKKNFVKLC